MFLLLGRRFLKVFFDRKAIFSHLFQSKNKTLLPGNLGQLSREPRREGRGSGASRRLGLYPRPITDIDVHTQARVDTAPAGDRGGGEAIIVLLNYLRVTLLRALTPTCRRPLCLSLCWRRRSS